MKPRFRSIIDFAHISIICGAITAVIAPAQTAPLISKAPGSNSRAYGETGTVSLFQADVQPTIVSQPARLTPGPSQGFAIRVAASGGNLAYQWYRGASGDTNHPLTSATRPTLLHAPLAAPANFWARISNSAGSVDSQAIAISAERPVGQLLYGMGSNQSGQLGDGTFPGPISSRTTPILIAIDVISASANGSHSLFLKTDGSLWGMGSSSNGQLLGTSPSSRSIPSIIATEVVAISAGFSHTHFVKNDGTLWALGANSSGQLGDGTTSQRTTPVPIATGVASVASGGDLFGGYTLYIKHDGSLWAMGANTSGQLGDGSKINRPSPVPVATDVASVSVGATHTLFVKIDGSLWAMGSASSGQLGIPPTGSVPPFEQLTPIQVATGVNSVAAGPSRSMPYTMFVRSDQTLWAMGDGSLGQFGNGTPTGPRLTPSQVGTDVSSVTCSSVHSLILRSDGSLTASGANASGQLGDGTTNSRSTAVLVDQDIVSASAGNAYSLYIKTAPNVSAFAAWTSAAGLSGSAATPTADPDDDGMPNLLEFAYGTSPALGDTTLGHPTTSIGTSNGQRALFFTHRRRKGTGLNFVYQTTSSLADPVMWTSIPVSPNIINSNVDGDGLIEKVSVSVLLGNTPFLFFRSYVRSEE